MTKVYEYDDFLTTAEVGKLEKECDALRKYGYTVHFINRQDGWVSASLGETAVIFRFFNGELRKLFPKTVGYSV